MHAEEIDMNFMFIIIYVCVLLQALSSTICLLYAVIEIVLNVLNQVGGWVPHQYIRTTEIDLMYTCMPWERHCMYSI